MSGNSRTAASSALATSSSIVTRVSANAGSALSLSTSRTERVTSTVTNSVTCGAVKALADIAAAVALRTPLTGIRVVSASFTTAGGPSACRSTSSRVTVSPDALTSARSTPSSFASLRTGGFARTPAAGADPLPAGCAEAAAGRRRRRVVEPSDGP